MIQTDDTIQLSILLIDDDQDGRRTLERFLTGRGYVVFPVSNGKDGLAVLQREVIDIVVTDLMMPEMNGFEVLKAVRETAPDVEVVIVTGYGDMDGAIRALREGAFDFFTKPIDMQGLTAALERTARFHALRLEKNRYRDQLANLQSEAKQQYGLDAIIGNSKAIQSVKTLICEVAETPATTVLISGETGTGKELVARAIHHQSERASGPFVAVDCTAVPEALAESELFGHIKGAFTDAQQDRKGRILQADSGTLFLDEVGDMSATMQARLLRVLEERQVRAVGSEREVAVDIRVVSASNRNLGEAISGNTFRQDLFYRLNTIIIQLPPLRDRRDDISVLAHHFLAQFSQEMRKPIVGFSDAALQALQAHAFLGNVRELRNVVERAMILCRHDEVQAGDLKLADTSFSDTDIFVGAQTESIESHDDLCLETFEKNAIREALRRTDGNQHQAANLLGISRFAIKRRMNRYGIF